MDRHRPAIASNRTPDSPPVLAGDRPPRHVSRSMERSSPSNECEDGERTPQGRALKSSPWKELSIRPALDIVATARESAIPDGREVLEDKVIVGLQRQTQDRNRREAKWPKEAAVSFTEGMVEDAPNENHPPKRLRHNTRVSEGPLEAFLSSSEPAQPPVEQPESLTDIATPHQLFPGNPQKIFESFKSSLSVIGRAFAAIAIGDYRGVETFIGDNPEILREDPLNFLKEALVGLTAGKRTYARACVQQCLLIRNCHGLTSGQRKDFFNALNQLDKRTLGKFLLEVGEVMYKLTEKLAAIESAGTQPAKDSELETRDGRDEKSLLTYRTTSSHAGQSERPRLYSNAHSSDGFSKVSLEYYRRNWYRLARLSSLGKEFAQTEPGDYVGCEKFVERNPTVLGEENSDYLVAARLAISNGDDELATSCVQQSLIIRDLGSASNLERCSYFTDLIYTNIFNKKALAGLEAVMALVRQSVLQERHLIATPSGKDRLSCLGNIFVRISREDYVACENFINWYPKVLDENVKDFIAEALLALRSGRYNLAESCVQQGIVLKTLIGTSAEYRSEYFENLKQKREQHVELSTEIDVEVQRLRRYLAAATDQARLRTGNIHPWEEQDDEIDPEKERQRRKSNTGIAVKEHKRRTEGPNEVHRPHFRTAEDTQRAVFEGMRREDTQHMLKDDQATVKGRLAKGEELVQPEDPGRQSARSQRNAARETSEHTETYAAETMKSVPRPNSSLPRTNPLNLVRKTVDITTAAVSEASKGIDGTTGLTYGLSGGGVIAATGVAYGAYRDREARSKKQKLFKDAAEGREIQSAESRARKIKLAEDQRKHEEREEQMRLKEREISRKDTELQIAQASFEVYRMKLLENPQALELELQRINEAREYAHRIGLEESELGLNRKGKARAVESDGDSETSFDGDSQTTLQKDDTSQSDVALERKSDDSWTRNVGIEVPAPDRDMAQGEVRKSEEASHVLNFDEFEDEFEIDGLLDVAEASTVIDQFLETLQDKPVLAQSDIACASKAGGKDFLKNVQVLESRFSEMHKRQEENGGSSVKEEDFWKDVLGLEYRFMELRNKR